MGHVRKYWEMEVFIGSDLRREIWAECRALGLMVKAWERMRTVGRVGSARTER